MSTPPSVTRGRTGARFGRSMSNHQSDDDVERAFETLGQVPVLELDVGVALSSDLQQSFAPVDADDVGPTLVQTCREPPVPAPKVENALAGYVTEVSFEEIVEPVDIDLRRVGVGDRIPQLDVR